MSPPPGTSRARLVRLGLWLSFWVVLFALTHTKAISGGRFEFEYSDIVAHVLLYSVLTWLGARYLAIRAALTIQALAVWAGIYAVYGAFDEWSQQFVSRIPSFLDWLADCTGIALATLWLLRRRGRLSEQRPQDVTPP